MGSSLGGRRGAARSRISSTPSIRSYLSVQKHPSSATDARKWVSDRLTSALPAIFFLVGSSCNFDLHVPCAIPTPTIDHLFYPKCSFQFLSRPPGDVPRYCNACEKDISGFLYHCRACGFDHHPCCTKLPMMLDDGRVQLYLYRKVSAGCNRCGQKGRSWSYRSTGKKYNLHVACVREMLVESWQEIYQGGGKGLGGWPGSPVRIPSLNDRLHNDNGKTKSKKEKYSEVAGLALQFVISAVLGDPTTLIAGVIGSLIARG